MEKIKERVGAAKRNENVNWEGVIEESGKGEQV